MVGIPKNTCGCKQHSGPHWLYTDYIMFEMNLKLLERCAIHVPFHFTTLKTNNYSSSHPQ
jgi:hypothetical protein